MTSGIDRDGFAVPTDRLPPDVTAALATAVEGLLRTLPAEPRGGVRDVLHLLPAARDLAQSPRLRRSVESVLRPGCVAVNGTLFDKAVGRNWKVPYHQDVTVRMRVRQTLAGWGPWWERAGVPHVWPPAVVLERMLAVRVHLDECGPDNGPLRVLPGSHRAGVLDADAIERWRTDTAEVSCVVPRGGVLLMRPLLLHASSTATTPGRRRVIHIEYAAADALPDGVHWYEAWGPADE